MAQGDRLNDDNSQDITEKVQSGVGVNGLEVLAATAVEGPDGKVAILVESQQVPLPGLNIPAYDYLSLTYVAAGNGQGEIETATYKTGGAAGTVVAVLTLSYNGDGEISSVTKS